MHTVGFKSHARRPRARGVLVVSLPPIDREISSDLSRVMTAPVALFVEYKWGKKYLACVGKTMIVIVELCSFISSILKALF